MPRTQGKKESHQLIGRNNSIESFSSSKLRVGRHRYLRCLRSVLYCFAGRIGPQDWRQLPIAAGAGPVFQTIQVVKLRIGWKGILHLLFLALRLNDDDTVKSQVLNLGIEFFSPQGLHTYCTYRRLESSRRVRTWSISTRTEKKTNLSAVSMPRVKGEKKGTEFGFQ